MKRIEPIKFLSVIIMLLLVSCACAKQPEALTWQKQYDLGLRYLSKGNYQEAIIAFRAAIEIDPKQVDAYLRLADAYVTIGDNEAAIAVLQQGHEATNNEIIRERINTLLDSPSNQHLESSSSIETTTNITEVPVEDIDIDKDYSETFWPLCENDLAIGDYVLGLELGFARQLLEDVEVIEHPTYFDDYYNSEVITLEAEDSILQFVTYPGDDFYSLFCIQTSNPSLVGPREICVGDDIESIMDKFPSDKRGQKDESGIVGPNGFVIYSNYEGMRVSSGKNCYYGAISDDGKFAYFNHGIWHSEGYAFLTIFIEDGKIIQMEVRC